MSNKFKIGDRVRLKMPTAKIDTIGVIDSFYYCRFTDAYIYSFSCEDTKKRWDADEMYFSIINDKPHHNDPREMNKQHSIGFKGGQEVKVEPSGVCTISNNNLGLIVSTPKADKTEPSHYKNQSIETIDMMVRIWGAKAVVLFCEINAFKYRMRVGSKEGESIEDDIKKAQWYEQRANELRE